jgi:hypothetical protein
MTGTGNAFRVMSTVLKIVYDPQNPKTPYIWKNEYQFLYFNFFCLIYKMNAFNPLKTFNNIFAFIIYNN